MSTRSCRSSSLLMLGCRWVPIRLFVLLLGLRSMFSGSWHSRETSFLYGIIRNADVMGRFPPSDPSLGNVGLFFPGRCCQFVLCTSFRLRNPNFRLDYRLDSKFSQCLHIPKNNFPWNFRENPTTWRHLTSLWRHRAFLPLFPGLLPGIIPDSRIITL